MPARAGTPTMNSNTVRVIKNAAKMKVKPTPLQQKLNENIRKWCCSAGEIVGGERVGESGRGTAREREPEWE